MAANRRHGREGVVKGKSWEPSDSFNNNINNNKGGIVNEFVPIVLDLRCWQNIYVVMSGRVKNECLEFRREISTRVGKLRRNHMEEIMKSIAMDEILKKQRSGKKKKKYMCGILGNH